MDMAMAIAPSAEPKTANTSVRRSVPQTTTLQSANAAILKKLTRTIDATLLIGKRRGYLLEWSCQITKVEFCLIFLSLFL